MQDRWQSLFDGATLDGWFASGDPGEWSVEDGAIVCFGTNPIRELRADEYDGTTYLCTVDRYEDFEFAFEYQLAPGGNSGVYFRWSELTDRQSGMEIQIVAPETYDDTSRTTTGALYDMVAPTADPAEPFPAWNALQLRCDGPTITVWINDENVLDVDIDRWGEPGQNPDGTANKFTGYAMRDVPRCGRIGLQNHDEVCRFRDLRIRPLV